MGFKQTLKKFTGIYTWSKDQSVDEEIVEAITRSKEYEAIEHLTGPDGYLEQLNRAIVDNNAHYIFNGLIEVPKIAQKTQASQLNKNLLLSSKGRINTSPNLKIIADDVKCKHGATISELNKEELFYMRSRGLTFAEASKLQLKSYYQEIIDSIPVLEQRIEFLDHLLN